MGDTRARKRRVEQKLRLQNCIKGKYLRHKNSENGAGRAGVRQRCPEDVPHHEYSGTTKLSFTRKWPAERELAGSAKSQALGNGRCGWMRRGEIDVVGLNIAGPFRPEGLIEEKADILLLTSRGSLAEDILIIRRVRLTAPAVRVLLVGMSEDGTEFFQYVRAGIKGYLPRDASAEDVLEAIGAVQAGEAGCPGWLCALLFQFFEREATAVHSTNLHPRLGLTRREQQIVPLIAQGPTNKEIANHFCLSEQTVKNHLYRMKHKIGAGDRLGIVHLCRGQGFLV